MASVLEPDELAAVAHDRTAFNLAVWDKVVANPEFQAMPWRFETDAHGQIIISPPPAPERSNLQFRTAILIERHAPPGKVLTECVEFFTPDDHLDSPLCPGFPGHVS